MTFFTLRFLKIIVRRRVNCNFNVLQSVFLDFSTTLPSGTSISTMYCCRCPLLSRTSMSINTMYCYRNRGLTRAFFLIPFCCNVQKKKKKKNIHKYNVLLWIPANKIPSVTPKKQKDTRQNKINKQNHKKITNTPKRY